MNVARFSAVRRDMFVGNAISEAQSSGGAACFMSPLTGLANNAFTIPQTFRTYGAVPHFRGDSASLAEQKRIVARVEELLRRCNTLEHRGLLSGGLWALRSLEVAQKWRTRLELNQKPSDP